MSFTDALSRISEIQQQMTALSTGTPLSASSAGAAVNGAGGTATATAPSAAGSSATAQAFLAALAQAQGAGAGAATGAGGAPGSLTGSTGLAGLTGLTGLTGLPGTGGTLGSASGGAAVTGTTAVAGSTALPASAARLLTPEQQQFASTLVAQTGLNPGVVCAWLLAEENGGAAQARSAAHNNDWLNIGYTDSGTVGAADSIWSDPVTAAQATAGWLKGQNTVPGYGTASAGIQSILATVGQSPAAQISALQSSGWASSGYPDLPALLSEVNA